MEVNIYMKNRTILGIICIVLAVTVMFGIAPIVNKLASQKTEIVRVTKNITQGQQITAEDIKAIEVGGYNLPDSVIKSAKSVIGKYAACDIKADDYLLPSKLTDNADSANDVFKTLNGTQQAISITIQNFAGGLSGKLKNGDIVSILVTEEKKTAIPAQLTYVKVITTTTANGSDKNEVTKNKDGTYDLPSTVTLLVNPEQAKLLAGYEVNAKLHIALVYRGDAQTAEKFLKAQSNVLTASEVTPIE
jgi:pilus assembly protein CpaB